MNISISTVTGDADVGVILNPARPFPIVWDQRRMSDHPCCDILLVTTDDASFSLPGPPLTNDTTLITLLEHGVIVGLGVRTAWEARNARFDVQWVSFPARTPDRFDRVVF
jgi:hypothetical protein